LKSDRAATLPNFPASHNQFPWTNNSSSTSNFSYTNMPNTQVVSSFFASSSLFSNNNIVASSRVSQTPAFVSGCANNQQNDWLHAVPINTPERPKPALGKYLLALPRYLDSRVSKCYGCKESLKPSSVIPACPNDLQTVP
jgi:hypothetical protein